MLYEFSPSIFINLKELVSMECHDNCSIVVTLTNRKNYTRHFNSIDEMEMTAREINSGVTRACHN